MFIQNLSQTDAGEMKGAHPFAEAAEALYAPAHLMKYQSMGFDVAEKVCPVFLRVFDPEDAAGTPCLESELENIVGHVCYRIGKYLERVYQLGSDAFRFIVTQNLSNRAADFGTDGSGEDVLRQFAADHHREQFVGIQKRRDLERPFLIIKNISGFFPAVFDGGTVLFLQNFDISLDGTVAASEVCGIF